MTGPESDSSVRQGAGTASHAHSGVRSRWPSTTLTLVLVGPPPIQRAAVRASGGLLLEIAERLLSGEPVGVRGVAMASRLIEDRRGPLYRDNAARPLTVLAFEALVQLDRGLRTISASDW